MKIAVIGSGISGIAVSWLLNKKFEIELYEKNNYIGGHSNTFEVDYGDKKIAVDTGFIVFNHRTYPHLTKLFDILGVKTKESEMSFSASINNGQIEYSGKSLSALFSQKKNIFNLQFLLMIADIIKFNKNAAAILESTDNPTLGEFLDNLKIGKYFRELYLLPMAAAIWSCPVETMKSYPAKSFVRFFLNHGLLTISDQPIWRTVEGGSREYVKLLCQDFVQKITKNYPIKEIKKLSNGQLEIAGKIYDKVIIATHSDQALEIIGEFNSTTKNLIRKFRYQKNIAVLHSDENLMPQNKKAWSSWNYLKNHRNDDRDAIALTYWMNLLQKIDIKYPLFVTLNSTQKINPNKIFAEFEYEHPIFDQEAVDAQNKIDAIQGMENLYFCGAYLGYGFHEDGLLSALKVSKILGVEAPWKI